MQFRSQCNALLQKLKTLPASLLLFYFFSTSFLPLFLTPHLFFISFPSYLIIHSISPHTFLPLLLLVFLFSYSSPPLFLLLTSLSPLHLSYSSSPLFLFFSFSLSVSLSLSLFHYPPLFLFSTPFYLFAFSSPSFSPNTFDERGLTAADVCLLLVGYSYRRI